jgi:hypothetical protein
MALFVASPRFTAFAADGAAGDPGDPGAGWSPGIRHGDVKTIQDYRDETVMTDQIDQLVDATLPE